MAEHGKETATAPPLLQETETTDGSAAATDPVLPTSEPAPQVPAAVAEPGKETTTPPPPAQETETTDGGAATPDPALPTAEPQEQPDAAAPSQPQQTTTETDGQPPTPTKAEEVATLPPPAETPSQEAAAAAVEAEKQLPAPVLPPQQKEAGAAEEASSVHEKEKGAAPARAQEGEDNQARRWRPSARRRWRKLWTVVRVVFRRPKAAPPRGDQTAPPPEGKGGKTKPSASGLEEKKPETAAKPRPKDSNGGVTAEPEAKERDREEMKPSAPDGKQLASGQEEKKSAPAPDGNEAGKTKPAPDGKQPASGLEKRSEKERLLEEILEDAFTRLLATEYKQLNCIKQKCLLTFSVFELASEVKKQAMIYWWIAEFNLPHRSDPAKPAKKAAPHSPEPRISKILGWTRKTAAPAFGGDLPSPQGKPTDDAAAEGIFSKLSDQGFLVPIKNCCSKVIHGCIVNPLVHWMVKRQARDDPFADLDAKGNPAYEQPDSSILCLTAGNREWLQWMRMEDEPQAGKIRESTQGPENQEHPTLKKTSDFKEIKGKRVILNVNAHVYPVSKTLFLHLSDCLVVLQLGRWCNYDDRKYMEVDGLESLDLLKNLRYLGLRGLSRLSELPYGIRELKKLAILDVRGCQNLVNAASKVIKPLKQLTHLDLTECFMLENICQEITSLSELQVFKGFVFPIGTQGKKACRLHDLKKLKKLQKLTISITTDANVGESEMTELIYFDKLLKLTITWGEIPSILEGNSAQKKRMELINKWTSFKLPKHLQKLDIRCYPKKELQLDAHEDLKKLYLRGGDLEEFSIGEPTSISSIETLRLRYLKNFKMGWEKILFILKHIEYVEIVVKDEKEHIDKDRKDNNMDEKDKKDPQKDTDKECKFVKRKIPEYILVENGVWEKAKSILGTGVWVKAESILDENGVWVKDQKEEENLKLVKRKIPEYILVENEVWVKAESILDENVVWVKDKEENLGKSQALGLLGPTEDPSTKAATTVPDVHKNEDDGDVIEEQAGKEQAPSPKIPGHNSDQTSIR